MSNKDVVLDLIRQGTLANHVSHLPDILESLDLLKWLEAAASVDKNLRTRDDYFGTDRILINLLNGYEACIRDRNISHKEMRSLMITLIFQDLNYPYSPLDAANIQTASLAFTSAAKNIAAYDPTEFFSSDESRKAIRLMLRRTIVPTMMGIRDYPLSALIKDVDRFFFYSDDPEEVGRRLKMYYESIYSGPSSFKSFEEFQLDRLVGSMWNSHWAYTKAQTVNWPKLIHSGWAIAKLAIQGVK